MQRNLLWLALIVSLGVPVIGSWCWMNRLDHAINRLTADVQALTRANLEPAGQLDQLADEAPIPDVVMLSP